MSYMVLDVPVMSTIIEPGRIDTEYIPEIFTPFAASDSFSASSNLEVAVRLIDDPNAELKSASNSRRIKSISAEKKEWLLWKRMKYKTNHVSCLLSLCHL